MDEDSSSRAIEFPYIVIRALISAKLIVDDQDEMNASRAAGKST